MGLLAQIDEDLNQALRGGEVDKVSTLRMLKSALHNQQIAVQHELSDDEVVKVLQKEAKQRKEAIESFENGGRAEMAAKEKQELTIIEAYLPARLSEAELAQLVDATIIEVGASGVADMGKVMGALTPKIAGRADGSAAAQMVKDRLSK